MAEVQIQIVNAQARQCLIAGVTDVFARQAPLGRLGLVDGPEEHLARHAERVARHAQVNKHVAHDPLRFPGGIGFGVVEIVDAMVVTAGNQFACFAATELIGEGDPRAVGQAGQLQTGRSQAAVLHVMPLAWKGAHSSTADESIP
jgi:hypothetical protein